MYGGVGECTNPVTCSYKVTSNWVIVCVQNTIVTQWSNKYENEQYDLSNADTHNITHNKCFVHLYVCKSEGASVSESDLRHSRIRQG